jgi:CTP synthase (UTP-ammonia lyase)
VFQPWITALDNSLDNSLEKSMEQLPRNSRIRIALVGDYSPQVAAHQAIPVALQLAAEAANIAMDFQWLATGDIGAGQGLQAFDGIWCVPASPYRNMQGALNAIRIAREHDIAFLGTCGGFQHALIEYARNQLGWDKAEHAETAPEHPEAIIVPLHCSLLDVLAPIQLLSGTLIAEAYGVSHIEERFQCRYGLRDELKDAMFTGALRVSAVADTGEVRAIELRGQHFFVATLFQPERAALQGRTPPLVQAFLRAAAAGNAGRSAAMGRH